MKVIVTVFGGVFLINDSNNLQHPYWPQDY